MKTKTIKFDGGHIDIITNVFHTALLIYDTKETIVSGTYVNNIEGIKLHKGLQISAVELPQTENTTISKCCKKKILKDDNNIKFCMKCFKENPQVLQC